MSWIVWALLAAVFAALTAIFAKAGLARIDSDLATLVRTAVIVCLLAPFVALSGKSTNPFALPPRSLAWVGILLVVTGAAVIAFAATRGA